MVLENSTGLAESFAGARALFAQSGRVLLTMHERMDGDDGGSLLAVAERLAAEGKQVTCAIAGGVPPHLRFLPGSERIVDGAPPGPYDLLVTFGCASVSRTGDEVIKSLRVPTLNVDHHPDNTRFGDVNIVDAGYSSVAEIIYDFFTWAKWNITPTAATNLLTGMITDTGSFMHSNTQPSTLSAAGQLMRKGAVAERIVSRAFRGRSPDVLRAWGRAVEGAKLDQKTGVLYAVLPEEAVSDLGPLPQGAFEGLVEMLNTVPEAKVALFLREEKGVVKGSLRSELHKGANVSELAQLFGGGGHKLASGFSVAGRLVKSGTGAWRIEAKE